MHDDHHPSLYFNVNTNLWRCFACEKGGNTITLVINYLGVDFPSACRWLADHFNIDLDDHIAFHPPVRKKTIIRKPRAEKSRVDHEMLQWLFEVAGLSPRAQRFLYDQRHYRPAAVEALGIASITDSKRFAESVVRQFGEERSLKSGLVKRLPCDENPLICAFATPCLIFPYRDSMERIVSVQSRYLGSKSDVPRFQFIKGSTVSIFNKPVLSTLEDEEPLYIAEGVTDCLALLSMGHKAVAIPSATLLKKKEASLLAHRRLMMYPDADKPGKRLYDKLSALMEAYDTTVTHLSLPQGCKDVSEWYCRSFTTGMQEI